MRLWVVGLCLFYFGMGLYAVVIKENATGWVFMGVSTLVITGHILLMRSLDQESQKKHSL